MFRNRVKAASISAILMSLNIHAIDRFDFLGVETWEAETMSLGTKIAFAELLAEQSSRVGAVLNAETRWSAPRFGLGINLGRFADFYLVGDLYGGLFNRGQVLHVNRSPRSWIKFHVLKERGWMPALGIVTGFKWPTANEPSEVDEGDFLLQLLVSKKLRATELHFNTGPVIYGDSERNSSQLHTWNYSLRISQSLGSAREKEDFLPHRLDLEYHAAHWLPGSWISFWNPRDGALTRSRVSLGYRFRWKFHEVWARGTQNTKAPLSGRSVSLGYAFRWGGEPQPHPSCE